MGKRVENVMYFKYPIGLTSAIVIILTFILFVLALLTKGWTQDLLLEAAVFLVSVKLIIMGYKNAVTAREIEKKLDLILEEEGSLRKDLKRIK